MGVLYAKTGNPPFRRLLSISPWYSCLFSYEICEKQREIKWHMKCNRKVAARQPSTVNRFNGGITMTIKTAIAFCRAFGYSARWSSEWKEFVLVGTENGKRFSYHTDDRYDLVYTMLATAARRRQ
jgi:hypothetical protein